MQYESYFNTAVNLLLAPDTPYRIFPLLKVSLSSSNIHFFSIYPNKKWITENKQNQIAQCKKERSTEIIDNPQSCTRHLHAFISSPPLSNCFNSILKSLPWISRLQLNLFRHFTIEVTWLNTLQLMFLILPFFIVQRKKLWSTFFQLSEDYQQ